jgi:hypothetical protein
VSDDKRALGTRHLIDTSSLEIDMTVTHSRAMRVALLATLGGTTLMLSAATRGSTAMFGGPWISIEAPGNPYDNATRGAAFYVHTYRHTVPIDMAVTAKAEGVVNGQRRSVPLAVAKGAQTGTYAVRNQWGDKGVWTVVVGATAPGLSANMQALVEIDADGEVGRVTVPHAGMMPRAMSDAEIERGLRDRARASLAVGSR